MYVDDVLVDGCGYYNNGEPRLMNLIESVKSWLSPVKGVIIKMKPVDPAKVPADQLLEICKGRSPCPFYGMYYVCRSSLVTTGFGKPALLDQNGNQCALIFDAYSPCQYVYKGKPSTHPCKFFDVPEIAKQAIEKGMTVYLDHKVVGCVPGTNTVKGVSFKEWWETIRKANVDNCYDVPNSHV
jgi:hypothetical protein